VTLLRAFLLVLAALGASTLVVVALGRLFATAFRRRW
jgi:hypothetical protein